MNESRYRWFAAMGRLGSGSAREISPGPPTGHVIEACRPRTRPVICASSTISAMRGCSLRSTGQPAKLACSTRASVCWIGWPRPPKSGRVGDLLEIRMLRALSHDAGGHRPPSGRSGSGRHSVHRAQFARLRQRRTGRGQRRHPVGDIGLFLPSSLPAGFTLIGGGLLRWSTSGGSPFPPASPWSGSEIRGGGSSAPRPFPPPVPSAPRVIRSRPGERVARPVRLARSTGQVFCLATCAADAAC